MKICECISELHLNAICPTSKCNFRSPRDAAWAAAPIWKVWPLYSFGLRTMNETNLHNLWLIRCVTVSPLIDWKSGPDVWAKLLQEESIVAWPFDSDIALIRNSSTGVLPEKIGGLPKSTEVLIICKPSTITWQCVNFSNYATVFQFGCFWRGFCRKLHENIRKVSVHW